MRRHRRLLFLPGLLLAALVLSAPAYADPGSGNVPVLPPQAKTPELPKAADAAKSTEAKVEKSTEAKVEKSTETKVEKSTETKVEKSSSGNSGAAGSAAVTSVKTAAAATMVYVMRGRIVQIVAPSATAVGSVSFRVTASSRLATRLRGMMITFALTKPTALKPGALVTVRLRAPVNAMVFGFDSATALKVAASG